MTFSWQDLVQLSGTDAWDDTLSKGCHMVLRIGTHMMLIVMVCFAVIVVMMKIDETIYQGQVKPDQHVEIYWSFISIYRNERAL